MLKAGLRYQRSVLCLIVRTGLPPGNVHVLGAVPLRVVSVAVANLADQLVVCSVTPDEVVSAPPERLGVSLGQPCRIITFLRVTEDMGMNTEHILP